MNQDELIPSPVWGGLPALQLHFGYNQWANQRILALVAKLTVEQLNAPYQTPEGSVYQLLIHMLNAEWTWRIVCQQGVQSPHIWHVEKLPNVASVMRFWQEEHGRMMAYLQGLTDADLNRQIDMGAFQNKESRLVTLLDLLMQLLNHSKEHRDHLAAYLDLCGYPPGNLDFLDYLEEVGA